MSEEHKVMCYWCHGEFRPVLSQIRLVCNDCYEKRPPDATGKELIEEFLSKLEEFELKRYSDMIRTLKNIRKEYEQRLKDKS